METNPNQETIKTSRRSRNRSAAERLQYLRQWEISGLTAEAFAKRHPVRAESLYRWRMKEKSGMLRQPDSGQSNFRELKIPELSTRPRELTPSVTIKSPALQVSISGVELDARFSAFLKKLSKEVFGV